MKRTIINNLRLIFFPYLMLGPAEIANFKNEMLIENIGRLKIIAVVGSLVNLTIILLSLGNQGMAKLLTSEIIFRLLWIMVAVAYFMLVGKPQIEEIKIKHKVLFWGAATLSLIFSGIITAVYSAGRGYIYLYIINVLLTGSFLYFSMLGMFVISLPGFMFVVYTMMTRPQATIIQEGTLVNISAVTLFAIVIAHTTYNSQIGQYRYRSVIRKQNEELHHLAELDPLTNIANRRKVDQICQREWAQAWGQKRALSLIMIDIDFFKLYNDTYGHPKGDECLKKIVEVLTSNLRRKTDFVGRYGGEEFIVLLPETSLDGATKIAESICYDIYNKNIPHSASIFKRLTVSMGVVSLSMAMGTTMSEMIEEADRALYAAKQNGRNKVTVA